MDSLRLGQAQGLAVRLALVPPSTGKVLTAEGCSIPLRRGCRRLADPSRCRMMRRILRSATRFKFWGFDPSAGLASGHSFHLAVGGAPSQRESV
jgi:hypothetical protein